VSNDESVLWIVVDLDVSGISLGEELHSVAIFFLGTVGDTIVSNVLHESSLDSSFDIRSGAGDSNSSKSFADSVKHFLFVFFLN